MRNAKFYARHNLVKKAVVRWAHDHVTGAQLESSEKKIIIGSYTWDLILILTLFHDFYSLTNG